MTEPAAPDDADGEPGITPEEQLELLTEWLQQLSDSYQALNREVLALKSSGGTAAPSPARTAEGSATAGEEEKPEPRPAPDWRKLSDDEAQETAAELHEWVEWLTSRFRIQADLPACWFQHPDLFEELSALWAAHTAAYASTAGPGEGLDWLAALDRAQGRWQRWNTTKCSYATHAPAGDINRMFLQGASSRENEGQPATVTLTV